MTAETGELIEEYYTNDRAKRIWIPELKMDLDDIKWFLESRCFDRNRPDKQILLERLKQLLKKVEQQRIGHYQVQLILQILQEQKIMDKL